MLRLLHSALLLLGFTSQLLAAERPNVLFIVADDLRVELGCYGSAAKTPHLDALAARGLRFDRAYCQQAVCNPSRSSFLTGKRPDTLRQWSNGIHFREKNPDATTLPQWFKANGYETRDAGKIFHNWHTKEKGDRRSWSADEFLHYANHGEDVPEVKGALPPNLALPIGRDYGKVPLCERRDVPDEAYYDGRVAAEAVKVLGQIKDKPFFLAVGFWKPHAPFNAPKKYWDLYDPAKLPPLNGARPSDAPAIAIHDSREILGIPPKSVTPSAAQSAEMRHGYFANISYMDAQVGKVLAALDAQGLREKTIVVFISDHGYHLGEHSQWGKTSCFEYDARVPLLVTAPGMKAAGKATTSLVELVDLFPTLNELCGLKSPIGLDGVSFAPLLGDRATSTKAAAFTQHPRPAYFDRTPTGVPEAMGYSVRTASGRYTEWRDWTTGQLVGVEYYDHSRDPSELANRINDPKAASEVAAARRSLHAQFPPNAARAAAKVKEVIGHRGSCADRPDNTLAGIRRAIAANAHAAEVDVRTTKDGALICMHDPDVDRTTDGKGKIADLTLKEIKLLDAGRMFDVSFAGERVPTLREVLEASKGRIGVMLDLKEEGEDYANRIAAEVKQHGEPKRLVIGVRSVAAAKRFRKLLPEARQIGLIPTEKDIEPFADAGVKVIRLWPKWLANESLVPRVRKAGCELNIGTGLGTRAEVLPLLVHEPESLSSDDPAQLIRTLAEIAEMK